VPVSAVQGIFARENGQGLFFPEETRAQSIGDSGNPVESTGAQPVKRDDPKPDAPAPGSRPRLQVVK